MCCNIKNINANVDELILLFENEKKFYKPDHIVLTETWYDTHSYNIFLPGYDMYFSLKIETKM